METTGNISAIVLAGGQSRRMGGGDKGLRSLGDRSILSQVIHRLMPQVRTLLISANGDPARFADFGLPVVADTAEGFQGPLAGVAAGLDAIGADHERQGASELFAVSAPGDTPFIPTDLVTRLMAGRDGSAMSVAISAAGLHPVVALWPVSMAQGLNEALARGERRASHWVKAQGAAEIYFEPCRIGGTEIDPFFNINTPEDLAYAQSLMAHR